MRPRARRPPRDRLPGGRGHGPAAELPRRRVRQLRRRRRARKDRGRRRHRAGARGLARTARTAMPGPEIQAAAIATALEGFPLRGAGLGRLAADRRARGGRPAGRRALRNRCGADRRRHRRPRLPGRRSVAFTPGVIVSVIPPLAAAFTASWARCSSPTPVELRASTGCSTREQRRGHEPAHPPPARVDAARHGALHRRVRRWRSRPSTSSSASSCHRRQPLRHPRHATTGPRHGRRDRRRDVQRAGQRTLPFDRSLHTKAIKRLKKAGAKVIIYDVQFTEPSGNRRQRHALIDAVRSGRQRRARRRRRSPRTARPRSSAVARR